MFVKDYISKDYPAFDEKTQVREILPLADDFGYSHLFVERAGVFVGALSRSFLNDAPEGRLKDLEIHFEKFAIREDAFLIDIVKLFYTFNANVVPILAESENYLGYISCDDVFDEFSKYPLFSENGAVILLQTYNKHYSFAEITRIVEENNAKIYGIYVSDINEDEVKITLKISNHHLSNIEEDLERFGYFIINKDYNDRKESLVKNRFDFFQKYIEI